VKRIVAGPPRPIRELNPHAPARLVKIAEGAMARDLRDRYAQMSDVVRDLDRVLREQDPLGRTVSTQEDESIPDCRITTAVLALLVGGIAYAISSEAATPYTSFHQCPYGNKMRLSVPAPPEVVTILKPASSQKPYPPVQWIVDNGGFKIEAGALTESEKGLDYSASVHATLAKE